MKKTYMPFWALLCALCASPSFAASNQPIPIIDAEADLTPPSSPTPAYQVPAVVHEAPDIVIDQALPKINQTITPEDPQEQSLLLRMMPDEILLHILWFLQPKESTVEAAPKTFIDETCKRLYRLKHKHEFDPSTPRNIFIHNKERFQEFCSFTFSRFSGEDKPLFPFPIKTINGTPLPQILRQNCLPDLLWSLPLMCQSSADLEELNILRVGSFNAVQRIYEMDFLQKAIPGTWLSKKISQGHGQTFIFGAHIGYSAHLPCVLPLLLQLPKLKILFLDMFVSKVETGGVNITTSLFGPSITNFSHALGRLTQLEELNINLASTVQIHTMEEAAVFAKAFKSMSKLKKLSLSQGSLGDEGMRALIPVLGTLPDLNDLSLCSMNIGAAGAQALIDHPELLIRLERLSLSSNNIGDDAIKNIAKILAPTRGMTLLDLCVCSGKTPEGNEIPNCSETNQYVNDLFKDYKNLFLVV